MFELSKSLEFKFSKFENFQFLISETGFFREKKYFWMFFTAKYNKTSKIRWKNMISVQNMSAKGDDSDNSRKRGITNANSEEPPQKKSKQGIIIHLPQLLVVMPATLVILTKNYGP